MLFFKRGVIFSFISRLRKFTILLMNNKIHTEKIFIKEIQKYISWLVKCAEKKICDNLLIALKKKKSDMTLQILTDIFIKQKTN